jgi:hypothetical protein
MPCVLGRFTKQPADILDYNVDYTDWFEGRTDTPAAQTATADPGIVIEQVSIDGFVVKVVVSGGTSGESYKVTVRLTTTNSLVKEADFIVRVREV